MKLQRTNRRAKGVLHLTDQRQREIVIQGHGGSQSYFTPSAKLPLLPLITAAKPTEHFNHNPTSQVSFDVKAISKEPAETPHAKSTMLQEILLCQD